MKKHTGLAVAALLALSGAGCGGGPITSSDGARFGVSLSPESFEAAEFMRFLDLVSDAGGILSWGGNAMELAQSQSPAAVVTGLSRQRGWTPVIVTGPTIEQLNDEAKRASLLDAIEAFAKKERPVYLGIGNEINFEFRIVRERDAMVDFFDDAAERVKSASPATRVFPIFQLEWMKGKRGGLFGGKDDPNTTEWDLLARFPRADMFAFTTYPGLSYRDPDDIPAEYYEEISTHASLPVAFTEIGWFRQGTVKGWESDEAEQASFIRRLPELLGAVDPAFVIWPFLFDQRIPAPFEHMGLLAPGSAESEGWSAWKALAADGIDKREDAR